MFKGISAHIADLLVKNKTITNNEHEVYCFGIQQGLNILLNLITILFFGIVFGEIWQSIVFTIAYIPLRSYAGGFHAKTPTRCYVFSCCLIAAVLLAIKYLLIEDFIYSSLLASGGIIAILLAPVDTVNKRLDQAEIRVYRNRTLTVIALETVAYVLSITFSAEMIYKPISLSFVSAAFMLILGMIDNHRKMKYGNNKCK